MLGLSDFLRLKAHAAEQLSGKRSRQDTSIIFIWLPGGPPHMEMYDMKPDAPEEYRGLFRPTPAWSPDGASVASGSYDMTRAIPALLLYFAAPVTRHPPQGTTVVRERLQQPRWCRERCGGVPCGGK